MMLVFVTRSCNAGTASAFKAHADRRPKKVQECVEVVRLTPHERGQRRTAEHIVDVPVLQALEQIVEMVKLVPQERVQQRIKVDDIPVVIDKRFNRLRSCSSSIMSSTSPWRFRGGSSSTRLVISLSGCRGRSPPYKRNLKHFSFRFVRFLARFRGKELWQGRVVDQNK